MKNLKELNGKEFSKVVDAIKDYSPVLHRHILNYYFQESGSIEESWNNDFDEVWDAEAYLADLCEQDSNLQEIVDNVLIKF